MAKSIENFKCRNGFAEMGKFIAKLSTNTDSEMWQN